MAPFFIFIFTFIFIFICRRCWTCIPYNFHPVRSLTHHTRKRQEKKLWNEAQAKKKRFPFSCDLFLFLFFLFCLNTEINAARNEIFFFVCVFLARATQQNCNCVDGYFIRHMYMTRRPVLLLTSILPPKHASSPIVVLPRAPPRPFFCFLERA